MRRFYFTIISLLLAVPLISQIPLSGIINTYTFVNEIDYCNAKLTVSNPDNFSIGESVIIIQMKGAKIDESDSGNFGNITNLNGAGLYERAEISNISGSQISLTHLLVNNYQISGLVQLVSLPEYANAQIQNILTAQTWNGSTGGVLALEVNGTLELNADISVNGLGFRGAHKNIVSSNCNFLTNANDFHYNEDNWRAAPKGEGIAASIIGKEWGRGAQANGGGGGNDHNSGGGGGGNISNGGIGGEQTPDSAFGCSGNHPGRGGKANTNVANRIYLGGGGGAGHVDNNNAGSGGANGGGIIILFANGIITNNHKITANGNTPSLSGGDGGGGGGAGGTLILEIINTDTDLSVEAKGGDGGDVVNPSDRCFGPGGGGSGGSLLTNLTSISPTFSGGLAGQNSTNASPCNGLSNGAMAGSAGIQNSFLGIEIGDIEISELGILVQPNAQTVCEGDLVIFTTEVPITGLTLQWQADTGDGFEDLQDGILISGSNSPNLTISSATTNYNNGIFQLVITNNCEEELISSQAILTITPAPVPNFSFTDLGDGTFQFSNTSLNADSYYWDFGDMNNSTMANPTHIYNGEGSFEVSLSAVNGCDSISTSIEIMVTTLPVANFSFNQNTGCAPFEIQFNNESSENAVSFEWQFEGGNPMVSTDSNPTVIYESAGLFGVQLIVSNTEGSDTFMQNQLISVDAVPVVNFNFITDGLNVEFINLATNYDGDLMWDFGDFSFSSEENPVHLYNTTGSFEVTLTASNDCGENSFTQTISTGSLPTANFTANITSDCAPVTVFFNDLSTGNVIDWDWAFPSGNPSSSNEQNPIVVYSQPGIYNVTLTVINDLGENAIVSNDLVEVLPPPEADFEFEINQFIVNFMNTSTNAINYFWNFGDNSPISNDENPTHTYTSSGIFDVTLTISTATCSSLKSTAIFVNPVAVMEQEDRPEILVYPNPTNNLLRIESIYNSTQNIEGQLFDLEGRLIKSFLLKNAKDIVLDISELPSGIYLLEMKGENWVWNKKVIKN